MLKILLVFPLTDQTGSVTVASQHQLKQEKDVKKIQQKMENKEERPALLSTRHYY